ERFPSVSASSARRSRTARRRKTEGAGTSKAVRRCSAPRTPLSIEPRRWAAIRSASPDACAERRRVSMKASVLSCVLPASLLLVACPVFAQGAARPAATAGLLRELNASVEDLTARVALSVVQVVVTGYAAVDERTRGETGLVIGRQRSIGSGAIVDPDGY